MTCEKVTLTRKLNGIKILAKLYESATSHSTMIGKGEARLLGGIGFVAPVRVYLKFIFCASTHVISLLIHGFLSVNARLLIAFGTAFYAIILVKARRCLTREEHVR